MRLTFGIHFLPNVSRIRDDGSGPSPPGGRRSGHPARYNLRMATASPAASGLERRFRLSKRGTNVRTEAIGGLSTFLTMSYILFVNPAILSAAKVPVAGVAVATALAAALTSAAMGLAANLPFALAPGLGINAVVAFDIVLAQGYPWQVAMACIVIEGLLALALVLAGLRETVVEAVPESLKLSIGVGIGLFITLVGLRQ